MRAVSFSCWITVFISCNDMAFNVYGGFRSMIQVSAGVSTSLNVIFSVCSADSDYLRL